MHTFCKVENWMTRPFQPMRIYLQVMRRYRRLNKSKVFYATELFLLQNLTAVIKFNDDCLFISIFNIHSGETLLADKCAMLNNQQIARYWSQNGI